MVDECSCVAAARLASCVAMHAKASFVAVRCCRSDFTASCDVMLCCGQGSRDQFRRLRQLAALSKCAHVDYNSVEAASYGTRGLVGDLVETAGWHSTYIAAGSTSVIGRGARWTAESPGFVLLDEGDRLEWSIARVFRR